MFFCLFFANWSNALHTSSWMEQHTAKYRQTNLTKARRSDLNSPHQNHRHALHTLPSPNKHSNKSSHKSKCAALKSRTCNTKFFVNANTNLIKTCFFFAHYEHPVQLKTTHTHRHTLNAPTVQIADSNSVENWREKNKWHWNAWYMRHVCRRTFKPNKYSKQTFNSKQSELEKHFLRSNLKHVQMFALLLLALSH